MKTINNFDSGITSAPVMIQGELQYVNCKRCGQCMTETERILCDVCRELAVDFNLKK